MNVFDTEHPLNSPKACPGFVNSGWFLCLRWVFVIALILFPFIAGFIWYLNVTDIGSTDDETDPFWMVAMAAAIGSLIFSILFVSMFRLCAWLFRALRKQRSLHTI